MSDEQELKQRLAQAILEYDATRAAAIAQEMVEAQLNPLDVLNTTVADTATEVGDRFENGEYFLPHLVLAGNAIEAATEVLQKAMPDGELIESKVVVIGTVEGDMHSLGKNIVAMMLRATGFEVHDLGVDVRSRVVHPASQGVGRRHYRPFLLDDDDYALPTRADRGSGCTEPPRPLQGNSRGRTDYCCLGRGDRR